MSNSREQILNALRHRRPPFHAAPPRPATYLPVTDIEDDPIEGLLGRFQTELIRLKAELFISEGEEAARACVLGLLQAQQTQRVAAWHFKYIPIPRLYSTLQQAGIQVSYPRLPADPESRQRELSRLAQAQVGLTGVDALIATTGTLVLCTGVGKTRIPSVLPPVHIAVATLSQLLPRLEDWLAQTRQHKPALLQEKANITFISGPSRTADIEKKLVVGVHGPRRVQVVLIR